MTESELVALEARWDAAAVRGWTPEQAAFAGSVGGPTDVWRLIAEVRRLRGAISRVLPALTGGDGTEAYCHLCDDFYQGPDGPVPHDPDCPVLVVRVALAGEPAESTQGETR